MCLQEKIIGGFTNSTYLSLIPKELKPSSFHHFRPISLCNSSYKIISKILANRIKPLLPNLISENQGGFVPCRKIVDNIMVVQESIHSILAKKKQGFILKLDMANAFDIFNLSFLSKILLKFRFSFDFIYLIKSCIIGPFIAPLINGRASFFYQSSRG